VQCPTHCIDCNGSTEDLAQVFFDCPSAIQVWQMASIWDVVQHTIDTNDTAVEVIFSLLHNLQAKLRYKMVAILWSTYGNILT